MNTGLKTLEWLYHEQLRVDAEWSLKTESGFLWWADRNMQRVEVLGTETDEDGDIAHIIRVETDFLRHVPPTARTRAVLNAVIMPASSMAGPVFDERNGTVTLCSLVRVHEGISEWMNPLISMACVLQVAEARIIGPRLAPALDAEAAESGHPQNGLRLIPDELADIIPNLVAPTGQESCRWNVREFAAARGGEPLPISARGSRGLSARFPCGRAFSQCEFRTDQRHPRYGNGLFVLQSFPAPRLSEDDGIRAALLLNAAELAKRPFGYGFGSYCFRDETIYFTSFFPNALYRRGLLQNFYVSCACRAGELGTCLSEFTGR